MNEKRPLLLSDDFPGHLQQQAAAHDSNSTDEKDDTKQQQQQQQQGEEEKEKDADAKTKNLLKFCLFFIAFGLNLIFASMAPFFSPVTKHHYHFTESQIGYVCAAFAVGYFIASAVLTLLSLSHWETRSYDRMVCAAALGCCVLNVVFACCPAIADALVDNNNDSPSSWRESSKKRQTLFWSFTVLRIALGALTATADLGVLLSVSRMFPHSISAVMGQWEAAQALGFVLGPVVGGLLYDAGTFVTPFVVTSAVLGILVIGTFARGEMLAKQLHEKKKAQPIETETKGEGEKQKKTKFSIDALKEILRMPYAMVFGCNVSCFFVMATLCFIQAFGALYLTEKYHLRIAVIGLLSGISATLYAATAVVIGKMAEPPRALSKLRPHMSVVGMIFLGLSMWLFGPCTRVPFGIQPHGFGANDKLDLALCLTGYIGFGICLAVAIVCSGSIPVDYVNSVNPALLSTSGALLNMLPGVGVLLGQGVMGTIIQEFGFEWTFFGFGATLMTMALVYWAAYLKYLRVEKKKKEEEEENNDSSDRVDNA